jgi:hypothetical protein
VGNPCDEAGVRDLVKSLKHQSKVEKDDPEQSLPMTMADMEAIMQWSKQECPDEVSKHPPLSHDERTRVAMHLRMRAYFTTCFTLMAR